MLPPAIMLDRRSLMRLLLLWQMPLGIIAAVYFDDLLWLIMTGVAAVLLTLDLAGND